MKKTSLNLLILLCSYTLGAQGYSNYNEQRNHKSSSQTFYNNGTSKIELLSSNINNTLFEVNINDYDLVEIDGEDDYYKIELDKSTPILNEGAPNLPKLNTSIIIPDNSNMELIVKDYEFVDIYDINIIPSKGNLSREINPNSIDYIFGDEYRENKFYPENLAELGEPYILRDLRGQGVIIYPFRYNAKTKTLRVYTKMLIEVRTSNALNKDMKNTLNRTGSIISQSNDFKSIYENIFINYYTDTRFEFLSDQGNMLIICYDDFLDEMSSFVEWKNKKGIPTEIVPLSSIGSSASQMQSFINDYYDANDLTYLLLVGDAAQMPTHIVGGSASDPTFGFIEGNDAFSEIIVGRFSANNPAELITQVERTLQYEQDPSSHVDHFNVALGIASNQGPGYGGLSDASFNDLLWDDFLSTFSYDEFFSVYDPSGSVSQGVEIINDGVGIINYTGHSGPTGWGNGAPLGVNDVNNLTNTDKLPFIFTVGCNPGQFNDYTECFTESWMRATDSDGNPTGAIGHLGSTISQSWEPPMHGQWAMNAILTESYENNISRSYGGIAVNGCMHMNEAQGSSGINETTYWTLFGDPSLVIRTDAPEELNVVFDSTILVGQPEFVVDVGVDGALVALSINGELKSYANTVGGVAILDLTNVSNAPGDFDLVVTAFNTYPFQETISVITTEGAYLVFDSYELVNDSSGNDFIQYGDEIEINILVGNVGSMNTNAINVTVTSDDEHITMTNGDSMIAYAIMNAVHSTEYPISFSISHNVPDGHNAQFDLSLDDGADQWQSSFNIEIHAPVFEILNPSFSDDNNDGVWDSGETATINVDLVNSGSAGYGWYPGAIITTENPYINILSSDSDNTFYAIDGNTTYQGSFMVEAIESAPLNTEVDFTISWGYSTTAPCESDDCVEQAYLTYSTIIGHPSILIWDPSSQHISGNRLVSYFEDNNISGFDYFDSSAVPSVENYNTAFIFLGVYPENHYLQEDEAMGFINILESGGNIYMEGGDTWAFDMGTSLHSWFGLGGDSDGSADLSTLSGVENTFTENMSFEYNGGNSYVDRIVPQGGFAILQNDDPYYITAIAYEDEELSYKTIGATHDIGGLQGEDFGAYIEGILEFFNTGSGSVDPECNIGDLNNDGDINVTDIIRLVNILISIGDPASNYENCASDINGDGTLNVLDVISLVNFILDRRVALPRFEAIEEINIIINKESLEIDTKGILKGIQLTVESDVEELSINQNLYMDIKYNKIDNLHHLIIFSMTGNYLEEGKYLLFESSSDYKIVDFIASNSNNQLVENNYQTNIVEVDVFSLKQNYPNPFNPVTNIEIELGVGEYIQLIIYDINGRKVRELANGFYGQGIHNFVWNSSDDHGNIVSSGMYIYKLISSTQVSTQKMLLLK